MRRTLGCALAGALAITASVAAQNPPQTPPAQPTPTTRTPAMQDKADRAVANVTVEGCLMREEDVPGRKPNVAERAGIAEDFILTQTKMIKGSAPSAAGSQAKAGEAVGTSGTRGASMYEVEGISEGDLKKHAGHRVQIEGTFENIDNARKTPESQTPNDDLVELRGTTIRQVAGECSGAK